ncbi:putative Gamma-glutamyl hydrolase A [Paratrimastix pyriformis]|uniref:folate gamma-glutamyl hydrolase n=1 Tax=Paratrimastix pyriformis TaxID=342808 RepID=A0ABQ8UD24_9EUKA|nr:putative Gamma-glutamyl hydrolase A [Paratrimastix pyriformis]
MAGLSLKIRLLAFFVAVSWAYDMEAWLRSVNIPIPTEDPSVAVNSVGSIPTIGILTMPTDEDHRMFGTSYIVASYVKWIEMAGGRVVRIPYDAPLDERRRLFNSVQGVLIQGGASNLITSFTPYYNSVRQLFEWVLEAHEKGDEVPLWGTCLGFEQLCILASHDHFSALGNFNAENITLPLYFTPAAVRSRLFGKAPRDVLDTLATQPVTVNYHHNGISPNSASVSSPAPADYPYLQQFFEVLSVNRDRDGVPFVSTVEARNGVPVWGVQWHPERAIFEHHPEEDDVLDMAGVAANQYLANFLVEQARRNGHQFADPDQERAAMMANWAPRFMEADEIVAQVYYWP